MNAATFDTHAAVKALRKAGADEAMAEAIVNTASAAAGTEREQLATKGDIARLETSIERLDGRIDGLRTELGTMRWTIGLLAAFMFAIGLRVFGIL